MSKSMYCPNCGAYVGDCGHVEGGYTGPSTLSGTCGGCERSYTVTCYGDCLKNQKEDKKGKHIINLMISEDGRAIIDEKGEEIAIFREGFSVSCREQSGIKRIPGHLECTTECIAWDSNGNCVRYYRSCTWVFDPID